MRRKNQRWIRRRQWIELIRVDWIAWFDLAGVVPAECYLILNILLYLLPEFVLHHILVFFLGHTTDDQNIRPLKSNVATILDYSKPTEIKQLRTFNGLVSFCKLSILNCASLMKPLTNQLRGYMESINLDDIEKKHSP